MSLGFITTELDFGFNHSWYSSICFLLSFIIYSMISCQTWRRPYRS